MTDLLDTARHLDISEFLTALESVGLNDSLTASNLTVFAPGNVAFEKYVPNDVVCVIFVSSRADDFVLV
jgi:uncharacterized surface protein with fasciclin (FAS1) repeats